MGQSQKILEIVQNSHKHRMVDFLNDDIRNIILDAIEIALFLNNKDVDEFDIEINETTITFTEKSYFDEKKQLLQNP